MTGKLKIDYFKLGLRANKGKNQGNSQSLLAQE